MMKKTIKVDYLARVEGEGALFVKIVGDQVTDIQFKIFEPPRFFEAFLRGRGYQEAPDITARICGICPIAYQMSAIHAIEDAFGIKVTGQLRALRRLIYCGEWIESHALHMFMLHAPDFLGYEDAIQMAKDHPEIVQRGLQIKKFGNDIVRLVGGREIHPINVKVGGFYKVPSKRELRELREKLLIGRDETLKTVRWLKQLNIPDFEKDYEFVALRHPDEYPFNEGRLVSTAGLEIAIQDFPAHFVEEHVAHSNALHCRLRERGAYCVGPQARFSLNFDRLSPLAQEAAREVGLPVPCLNPFLSIVIRGVELLYAYDEAIRIIDNYDLPDHPSVEVHPVAGTGHGCTEAPRGILYHRYSVDEEGLITDARIIPPTSQNQKSIEQDLQVYISRNLTLPTKELTWQCEQAIRNYDPCISCATHFLKLEIERS